MSEDISVAAAILTAEFVRRGELKEADAYLLWRRLRSRMQAEINREESRPTPADAEARENAAAVGGGV